MMNSRCCLFKGAGLAILIGLAGSRANADDWPMFGRDRTRNSVSPEKNAPLDWDVGRFDPKTGKWLGDKARNVKWVVPLGSQTFAAPVVADGQVYIGTNNGAGYLKRYPSDVDLGCMLCFRESDGEFLWQYSAEKLRIGRNVDWPTMGIGASPLVEGDRMWFVTNRYEVVCLDTQGFRDKENDGPYQDEPVKATNEADIVWRFDLIKELGVHPRNAGMGPNRRCSPAASYQDRIYVVTGNGVDEGHTKIPAPNAPSLVCFHKDTGKVLWKDASPGKNILDCQVADPLVIEIGGRGQVIVPQGDGWVRSFDALTGKLIWEFDINPKESKWLLHGRGSRNNILATPVYYKGRVYLGSGQQAEYGEGIGHLVCIDPTKTGDVSSELAVDAEGRPLPYRRIQAVVAERGERAIANPNSGLIWEFTRADLDRNGEIDFEEQFHRTVSRVAIKDDLLIAADFSGIVHCFDVRTGERRWAYDALATSWCGPLIVDDKVYIGDEDGELMVFNLSADPKQAMQVINGTLEPINRNPAASEVANFSGAIYSSPVYANGVLYVATRHHLFAIADPKSKGQPPRRQKNERSGDQDKPDGASLKRDATKSAGRAARSVFAPTPQDVVEKLLEAAGVKQGDTVVDLGSGDGRIVITAAQEYGARAIGYEIDQELVRQSRQRIEKAGLTKLAEIKQQDMYTADLSDARIVAVYLYPASLEKLKSQFARMKAGSWIVAHHYAIPEWQPARRLTVPSKVTGNDHRVFLYKMPVTEESNRP